MVSLAAKPLKKLAYPCVTLDGYTYLAGFGTSTKYEDPDGCVYKLIQMMDGTRTVQEIAALLCHEYKTLTPELVIEAILDFDQDGFLEDTLLNGNEIIDGYKIKRYHRNINFLSTYADLSGNKYELQKKLCDAKVCVLGLGGLGSHIVYDLAGLGIGHIRAVEFDTVDLSNLNRQILYSEEDLGLSKAVLATKRIRNFNSDIEFEVVEKQLTCTEDVLEIISGFQYVILVADRPKTLIAKWVNEACVKTGAVLLAAGLEAQRGMHYTVIPGVTGCIECWLNRVKEHDPVSYAILEERRRLNLTGDNTAIVPLVSAVTGMVNAELVRLITGIKPSVAAGKLITIDFDTMTTNATEEWHRDSSCGICADM